MLELKDIKEKIQNPTSKREIKAALDHEARLRFHSQTVLDPSQERTATQAFLSWVEGLIPSDKYAIFLSLFRYPVKTVNLTQLAYTALEKVFDGRDASFYYEFLNPEDREDWDTFQAENLNEPWVWREEGFEVMKTAINSFIVVDLPREQTGNLPEPYFYFLSMSDVLDFAGKKDKLDYIIFKQPDNRIAVIDDVSYRVFLTEEGGKEIKSLEVETAHDLGYCPARTFWTTPISRAMPSVKRSPITNHLGDLDWYLFFATSKRHLDLYAPYPIYSGYEQACDYEMKREDGLSEYCDRGYLRDDEDRFILRNGHVAECPVCSKKRIAGVGSFVEIPPPSRENDGVDMRNPIQITTVDRSSLDYNTLEIQRLEKVFYESVTGYGGEPVNSQAINRDQVKAFFEGRTNTLRNLKKDFETAQQWTDETICRLRYGASFVSATVDYGNEFYLLTADDLLAFYLNAQKEGADSLTLDTLQVQYYETRFRNNPAQLARAMFLLEVEPLRHVTKEQLKAMYKDGEIKYEDYFLKANFSSLVMRFERENTSVTEFATAQSTDKRVKKITEILISYIEDPDEEDEAEDKEETPLKNAATLPQGAVGESSDDGEGEGEGEGEDGVEGSKMIPEAN